MSNKPPWSSPLPEVDSPSFYEHGGVMHWLTPKGSGEAVPLTGARFMSAYTAAIQAVREEILPWDALVAEREELTIETTRGHEQKSKLKSGWRLKDPKSESSIATLEIRLGCIKERDEAIAAELEERQPAIAAACSAASRMIGARMDPLREAALAQQRAGLLVDYPEAAANEIFSRYWEASRAGQILGRINQGGLINNLKQQGGPGEPRVWADAILAADAELTKFIEANAHLMKAVENTVANSVPEQQSEKFTP